jgi:hypothetical protein
MMSPTESRYRSPSEVSARKSPIPIIPTKAIASARKHLQALHLPDHIAPHDEEGSASRIAKTLDDVVFQTNLLTLNAAVETYRTDEVQAKAEKAVPPRRTSVKSPKRDPKKTDLLSESS